MFEKYTERAVAIITTAQDISKELKHNRVYPEHFLLSLYINKYGICAKLFNLYKTDYEKIKQEVQRYLYPNRVLRTTGNLLFSRESRDLFRKISKLTNDIGGQSVLPEHIFLTLIKENENVREILKTNGFDINNAQKVLLQILYKKSKTKEVHPEEYENEQEGMSSGILSMLDEDKTKAIFENALSKLSTKGYEILGTEQIMQSVLDSNSELKNILENYGITLSEYNNKLEKIQSRKDEFCGRQIIFTPNAFKSVLLGVETAKELGSAELKPEHIILGILKNRSGIAYNLIKSFNVDEKSLSNKIVRSLERELNEALMILRFAKEEAYKFGVSTVGTEMILLGIIIESYGAGARTLSKLGITLHDAKSEVSKIIKNGDRDFDNDMTFSRRAKKVLEIAWEHAQKRNKTAINSEDLLMGIVSQKSCVAMQVLMTLGADVIELKQGILNELNQN